MIYLVSQMILALCVAVILGAALGWMIHRAAHNRQTLHLRQVIARYKAQQSQAQSDIAMLNEDFDELQRQSNDQIAALQQENSQIPALSTNLEKSQLLVKQMMQRHEGALRDLNNENQRLSKKLAKIEAQELVKNQLATGLEARRKPVSPAASSETENPPNISRFAAAEADDDPFDEVIEVAQELQQELVDQTTERQSAATTLPGTPDAALAGTDASHSDTSTDSSEADDLDAVYELDDIQDLTDPYPSVETQTAETDDTGSRPDKIDSSVEPAIQPSAEFEFDGSHDEARLFEPVNQQDDLQQIFGIGPLTEKALNELGITSYSQLATLKKSEIQRIADALDIGPARIERDNWVGNARRQLEEVLEQL